LDARAIELILKGTLALGAVITLVALAWDFFVNATAIKDILGGAALVLLVEAFLFFLLNLVALDVRFYDTKLVRRRGVWPFKRTDIVSYTSITRVRASDTTEVTVDLDDGRRLKLADLLTEVAQGPLPDVELKAGEVAYELRMRKIARFIERAVEEQRAASG
jgi:hypothetical protein